MSRRFSPRPSPHAAVTTVRRLPPAASSLPARPQPPPPRLPAAPSRPLLTLPPMVGAIGSRLGILGLLFCAHTILFPAQTPLLAACRPLTLAPTQATHFQPRLARPRQKLTRACHRCRRSRQRSKHQRRRWSPTYSCAVRPAPRPASPRPWLSRCTATSSRRPPARQATMCLLYVSLLLLSNSAMRLFPLLTGILLFYAERRGGRRRF